MYEQEANFHVLKGVFCADNVPFQIILVTTVEGKKKFSLGCHPAVLCQAGGCFLA